MSNTAISSHATVGKLDSADTSANVLAENLARRGLTLVNTDSGVCYVKFGATASTTSFTIRLAQNESWYMKAPVYTGVIDAIWVSSSTGSLVYTEQ